MTSRAIRFVVLLGIPALAGVFLMVLDAVPWVDYQLQPGFATAYFLFLGTAIGVESVLDAREKKRDRRKGGDDDGDE